MGGRTVGAVARLAHTSVRALHHYDAIGLLRPSGRSRAGYRVYTSADLERLQQILFFRELGFSLEDIGRILGDRGFDRRAALVAQRALLVEKGERLRAMVALVDRTLASMEGGKTMKPEEMFEVFGDFDPRAHEEEAERRWGKTDAYAESKRRTQRYGKDDWKAIRDEMSAIDAAWVAAMEAGARPTDAVAMDVAERARLQIDRRFYPCSHAMHEGLGNMVVSDARFTERYEKLRPGLAQFVCEAIRANAERARKVAGQG
jgi:DNA-binding transcriptional MerR regulator